MNASPRNRQRKSFDKVRGLTGMAMGVVYLIAAVMVVYAEKHQMIDVGLTFAYLIGGIAFLYGLFRIYRGWKIRKNATAD